MDFIHLGLSRYAIFVVEGRHLGLFFKITRGYSDCRDSQFHLWRSSDLEPRIPNVRFVVAEMKFSAEGCDLEVKSILSETTSSHSLV